MRWLVAILLAVYPGIANSKRDASLILHLPLVSTREIPCGFEVSSGVDDNDNGILELDERISLVIICDKDQDYNPDDPMAKTIIRTQGK